MTIILWTHPRSVSTAFERTVAERSDFKILHEPFSDLFYGFDKKAAAIGYKPQFDFEPSFSNIKDFILKSSNASDKLFIKDMAYHCYDYIKSDFNWLINFKPVFLIRHPEKSIPSHYKLNNKVTSEEIGYDTLFYVYQKYLENGIEPLIIDAAEFTANPEKVVAKFCDFCSLNPTKNMLNWQKEAPKEWKAWDTWHKDAASSKKIEQKNTQYLDNTENHPLLKSYLKHHLPFYEKLLGETKKKSIEN